MSKPIEGFFDEYTPNFKLWHRNTCPPAICPSQIIFQAPLLKLSTGHKLKSRYFVLTKDQLYYFYSEANPRLIAVMCTKYVRMDLFINKVFQQKENTYGFRFIKNMRYCDLYAEDESTFLDWRVKLARVFIQCDFHQKFTTLKMIGKGSFARVYLVENKESKEKFAVKAFSKEFMLAQPKGKDSLINEINVMRSLNHPNIIRLEEVHESVNSVYLVTEMLEGGELLAKVASKSGLEYSEVARVMRCMMKSLSYLAERNLMHRDLKPDNMILKDNSQLDKCTLKLIDFGLATSYDVTEYIFKRCGTPGFVAPEIINGLSGSNIKYTSKCDVFSAGIIFYLLLTGKYPFEGTSFKDILQKNKACKMDFKHYKIKKEPLALDLLQRMLEIDPEKRISAREVLQHVYLAEVKEQTTYAELMKQINGEWENTKLQQIDKSSVVGNSFLARKDIAFGRIGSIPNSFDNKAIGISLKSMTSPRKTSGHISEQENIKHNWLQNDNHSNSTVYGNNFTEEEIISDSENLI